MAYARIEEGFWTDPKIKGLPLEGKLIAAWLFTNPHRHFSGLYYLPMVLIPVEIGVSIGVSDRIVKLLEEERFLKYSSEFSVVWVVNMLKHQSGGNRLSPQQITGIMKHLMTLHGCPLIDEFVIKYQELGVKYEGKIDTPIDTPIDTKSQSQSQSQSQEKSKALVSSPGGNGVDEEFEIWWKAYPSRRKQGKPAAIAKYRHLRKAGKLPPLENLLITLEAQKQSLDWTKEAGEFIPGPVPYLNQGKYIDESLDAIFGNSSTPKRHNNACLKCKGTGTYQKGTMPDNSPAYSHCNCEATDGPKTI